MIDLIAERRISSDLPLGWESADWYLNFSEHVDLMFISGREKSYVEVFEDALTEWHAEFVDDDEVRRLVFSSDRDAALFLLRWT